MPIYEYEHDGGPGGRCSGRFEVFQKMSDQPLSTCPTCGQPCHRVVSAPAKPVKNLLGTASLAEKGFTKYVKTSDGTYEKQAGPGPELDQPGKKHKRPRR